MKVVDHDKKIINLTNSSRNTFDSCHAKFYYGNMVDDHGIRLAGPYSAALLVGDLVHEMFAARLLGLDDHDVLKSGWKVVNRAEEAVTMPSDKIEKNLEQARCMVPGLVEVATEVKKVLDKYGAVAAVEEHMSIPLGTVDDYKVVLHGKLDVLLENDEGLMVVDHKTVSAFKSAFHDRCQFDPQLTTYSMLAVPDWETEPGALRKVAYNVFRKPTIRKKKSETAHEFSDRLTQYLVETHPSEYLKMIDTSRTFGEMIETQIAYLEVARDILSCERRGIWRQCTATCDLYAGCPYLMICSGVDDGSINYVRKRSAHEEINEESDEW